MLIDKILDKINSKLSILDLNVFSSKDYNYDTISDGKYLIKLKFIKKKSIAPRFNNELFSNNVFNLLKNFFVLNDFIIESIDDVIIIKFIIDLTDKNNLLNIEFKDVDTYLSKINIDIGNIWKYGWMISDVSVNEYNLFQFKVTVSFINKTSEYMPLDKNFLLSQLIVLEKFGQSISILESSQSHIVICIYLNYFLLDV